MNKHQKMHTDEIEISDNTVIKLIREQFPQFGDFPISRVKSTGTVNAIYRLGEEYCIRLPLLPWADKSLRKECDILPFIAGKVTLAIPQVIGLGKPNAEYPLAWAIYGWLNGEIYDGTLTDETETAKALARFITELHSIEVPEGAPKAGRKPLRELDESTVNALKECKGDIDEKKALKLWDELLSTTPWDGNPVWIHADLLKPNLLVSNLRLSAVIDFGSAGVGDPAFDIIPAWAVLTSNARGLFRSILNVDDNTWLRAQAYALHQAALIIPYYRESNPAFVVQAKHTIENML